MTMCLRLGRSTLAMRAMSVSLTLLVLGVLANHAHDATAADHLALRADSFDGRTDLHGDSPKTRFYFDSCSPSPPRERGLGGGGRGQEFRPLRVGASRFPMIFPRVGSKGLSLTLTRSPGATLTRVRRASVESPATMTRPS